MFTELFAGITQQLMSLILAEIVFMTFIERSGNGFKFRFSSIEGYRNLKPFTNVFTVAVIAFLVYLLLPQIFELTLGKSISSWLVSLVFLKLLTLTIALGGTTLLLFIFYTYEKKSMDKRTASIIILTIITFLIFFLI